jgi:hypothetical protein
VNAFLDFMARYLTRGVVRATKELQTLLFPALRTGPVLLMSPKSKRVAHVEVIELLLTALPRNAYDPDLALHMIEDAGISPSYIDYPHDALNKFI